MRASHWCASAHIAQRGWKTRSGIPSQMTSMTQLFYVQTLPSFSSVERTCVAIFFLRWSNERVTSKLLYRSKSTNYQESKTNYSGKIFSLITWEHSLYSSLFKRFILPCLSSVGLRISLHGFFIQKVAIERQKSTCFAITKNTTVQLRSDCDWNCAKEPQPICTF